MDKEKCYRNDITNLIFKINYYIQIKYHEIKK